MSIEPSRRGKKNPTRLWKELQDLEDGILDPEKREVLMADLRESHSARQAYLEYFHQTAVFRMEAAKMHEQGLLPFVVNARQERRMFSRSLLAAAALLLLAATVAALISITLPKRDTLAVSAVAGTRWAVDGEFKETGKDDFRLEEGATVRVVSGSVAFELKTGAKMVIQGPALARFPAFDRPFLEEGWLWIDSGESSEKFEVSTPDLIVRDIGTRFGVRAGSDDSTEVHLVYGVVEVISRRSGKKISVLKPGEKGSIFTVDGKRSEIQLAIDPFPGLEDLLGAKPAYRTIIMGQAPEGYWRFHEPRAEDDGVVANEVLQSNAGNHPPRNNQLRYDKGPSGVHSFGGFEADNQSLHLTGTDEKSLVSGLVNSNGVSRKEGAVSFWIRRLPENMREEALWLAGDTDSGRRVPDLSMIYTQLTPSGHVLFCIRNGASDIKLLSSRGIADDKWHQIVASWGPTAVELYIDGKRSARDDAFRELEDALFGGSYVRFGKPGFDLVDAGVEPFSGWVDEIALWNRALTAQEVNHQYKAAIGPKPD